jgi:glycosyltransferase involved in cell wall biosynthesis
MRVLHIIQRYWPAVGGAESHLREISTRLVADGHQVTVATTDALEYEYFWDLRRRHIAETVSEHEGVRILRFPVHHLPASSLAYAGVRRLLWLLSVARPIPPAVLACVARLTPWVPGLWNWLQTTDEAFDLVAGMTICFEPLLDAGLRFARRRTVPFVIYPLTHLGSGSRPGHDSLSRFYTMRHQVALVRSSEAVLAQTPSEKRFYVEHDVPDSRIMIAGPGIQVGSVLGGDGARFRTRHEIAGPLVASLSPMGYEKGTVHLVEAVRRLWQTGRQIELVLAGTVTEPFERYLAALPATDRRRLKVLGPIDDTEKRDMLAAMDVFAMPSRTDSFGIVYLEAWIYRKPVVGALTWGVTDVIDDGRDGLLVPFGDVPALERALRDLLDDPERRAAMGAAGEWKATQRHAWDRKYPAVRDLYEGLAGKGR